MVKRKNFSLDKKVAEDFEQYCKKNSINMSKWVENKMRELIYKDDKK